MNSTKHELAVGSSETRRPKRDCEICVVIKKLRLPEGVHDSWFCAHPLKRAIERLIVRPLSDLMVTGQLHCPDRIGVTHRGESPSLSFFRETEARETWKTDGVAA
jgi:ATP-dependent Clp protease ATP-binding subunit ClpA